MRLRCRLGIHRWTVAPRRIIERARKAGIYSTPDWYVGPRVPEWCVDCEAKR